MHLSRFQIRFTIRWLMIGVAIAGVMLAAFEMKRRESYCLGEVRKHELQASRWADEKGYAERRLDSMISVGAGSVEMRRAFKDYGIKAGMLLDYHKQLVSKYRRAARYPWCVVGSIPLSPREPDDLPVIFICE